MGMRGWSKAPGAVVVALVAAALLTGCGSEPAAHPSASAPAPAETTTEPAAPTSRLGLECADLVPAELAAATVTAGLVVLPSAAAVLGGSPIDYAIEQLGGIACAATDPTAPAPVEGVGPTVPGYTVLILPDATEQYGRYAELYPGVTSGADALYGDSSGGACFGRGAESSCTSSILVGSTWIAVALRGIDVDAAFSDDDVAVRVSPLIESIVRRVAAAPAPGPLWTPAATAVALPDECAGYGSADEVRSTFERAEELWVGPAGGGGWSLSAGAWAMSGAQRCSWLLAGSDRGVLSVEALPAGAWAYGRMTSLSAAGTLADRSEVSIPGVERASFGCATATVTCALDAVIGGNWVRFSSSPSEGDPDLLRERLIQTAAAAAARLSG